MRRVDNGREPVVEGRVGVAAANAAKESFGWPRE